MYILILCVGIDISEATATKKLRGLIYSEMSNNDQSSDLDLRLIPTSVISPLHPTLWNHLWASGLPAGGRDLLC